MRKNIEMEVEVFSLNERGYGVGKTETGEEVFVLNSLPGEIVLARFFKKKKGHLYGTAEQILKPSLKRIAAKEDHFLACSPWQILDFEEENNTKKELIKKIFKEYANYSLSDFQIISKPEEASKTDFTYGYRNKVEYSFFGDNEEKIHLAFFKREGNFGKYPIQGCGLVHPKINETAKRIVTFLNHRKLQARQLKSLLIRYSYFEDKVVAALFVKDELITFEDDELKNLMDETFSGLIVAYSTKKSPASVVTEFRNKLGQTELTEKIGGIKMTYSYDGFFQVNIPIFELAAKKIKQIVNLKETSNLTLVDLYSGVGTLGLILAKEFSRVVGVEIFPGTKDKALTNAKLNLITNFEFIETSVENSLEIIKKADILIVDPPRIGIQPKVLQKIKEIKPKTIIYLSCNPKTQAENFSELKDLYQISDFEAFNFYPHTPHVENLIVLDRTD